MGTDHSKTLCFLRLASFEELEKPLGGNLGQALFALSFSPWQQTGTVNLAVKSPGGQKRYIKKRPAKIAANPFSAGRACNFRARPQALF
jgi:hypothetical protein